MGTATKPFGSSAPARRRLALVVRHRAHNRFIRARAETTTAMSWMAWANAVHPRSRGDDLHMKEQDCGFGSSAPRGDDPTFTGSLRVYRGSSASARRRLDPSVVHGCAVHPRPRGDDLEIRSVSLTVIGSSAPARRRLVESDAKQVRNRFIRARAETTNAL